MCHLRLVKAVTCTSHHSGGVGWGGLGRNNVYLALAWDGVGWGAMTFIGNSHRFVARVGWGWGGAQ